MLRTRNPVKIAYSLFKARLAFPDFETRVNALGKTRKWNFVRACILYKQALKCGKKCDPNVAMLFLCSCAEAMKVAGQKVGSTRNFMQFYMTYCPLSLRISPIRYYPNAKPPIQNAPFSKSLAFIYARFRCLYVHSGIGRLQRLPKGIIASLLLDKYKNEYFEIDTLKILNWFAPMTLESLFAVI